MLNVNTSKNLYSNRLPESLQPSNIPRELKALEDGRLEGLSPNYSGTLSGGSTFSSYLVADSPVFAVVVDFKDRYPEVGKIAVNAWYSEKCTLLDGALEFEINGTRITMAKGDFVVLLPGDSYAVRGSGRLVAIADNVNGEGILTTQFSEPTSSSFPDETLYRAFLRFLMTGNRGFPFAGAEQFIQLKVDPGTVPLEIVTGSVQGTYGAQLKIEKLQRGPGVYRYQDKDVYNLNGDELAVTYHFRDIGLGLSGHRGSVHRKLRIPSDGPLENIERTIFRSSMS